MKILVTGARGFVGQHLTAALLRAGHAAYAVDIGHADLAKPGEGETLLAMTRPELVVHLAARYGRLLCRDEPHRAVADNTAATTELAAGCARHGIPIVYASSSEVYGDQGTEPITELSPLHMPTTIYGLSKRWGEEVLELYLDPDELLIVRMNMLYGPGQIGGYGRCSLATFIQNAVSGFSFTVHRGTSRSWLYIDDAVRALVTLIEGGHRGIFNLGNPEPAVDMLDVAELVVQKAGGLAEIADAPADQIRHKNYDSSKLLATIAWQPEVSLAEGIDRTIAWAKEGTPIAA